MSFNAQDVERKVFAILRVLDESSEALGARIIARRLKDLGVELGERAVRYHLKMMDERGTTRLVGRDGRLITEAGQEELRSALVRDKVGFAISRIELLAFRTEFDLEKRTGQVPVNVSFFARSDFEKARPVMAAIFDAGLCVSDRVLAADEGETLGELTVPPGKLAVATVCSVVVNGCLLKAGIPIDSRFGGILQLRHHDALRFVELIHYAGSSLDPTEVFIRGEMTAVGPAARTGNGKILANFREIPAVCRPVAETVIAGLKAVGINGVLVMGNTSEPVCEIPVELNRIGIVLVGGLNPVAAVGEAGIKVESHAMSTVVDYRQLVKFSELKL